MPVPQTTKLERAKWDYDRALQIRATADAALTDADKKVRVALAKFEEAKREAATPVDRSQQQLASGAPIPDDRSHVDLKDSGQQKDYVVLTPAERAKGFKRPVRGSYRHLTCGAITTMSMSIAETYARDPQFYNGTFCSKCRSHFPIGESGEFVWYEHGGRDGLKVGT